MYCSLLCRLGVYRLVMSHTFLYKKLDEYGKNHNEKILKKVICEGERLLALEKTDVNFDDHPLAAPDTGRKIVFDNFDFKQQVRIMYRLLKWHSKQSKAFNSSDCGFNSLNSQYIHVNTLSNVLAFLQVAPVSPKGKDLWLGWDKCSV